MTRVEEQSPHQFLGRLGNLVGYHHAVLHGMRIRQMAVSCVCWLALWSELSAEHSSFHGTGESLQDHATVWGPSLHPQTYFLHLFPGAVTVPAASLLSGPSCVPAAPPFLLVMLKMLSVKPTAPLFQVQKCACILVILETHFIKQLCCVQLREIFFAA